MSMAKDSALTALPRLCLPQVKVTWSTFQLELPAKHFLTIPSLPTPSRTSFAHRNRLNTAVGVSVFAEVADEPETCGYWTLCGHRSVGLWREGDLREDRSSNWVGAERRLFARQAAGSQCEVRTSRLCGHFSHG